MLRINPFLKRNAPPPLLSIKITHVGEMLDLLPTSPSRTVLGQIFPFDFVEYLNAANCLEGAVSEVIKFQVWGKKVGGGMFYCVCACVSTLILPSFHEGCSVRGEKVMFSWAYVCHRE